MAALHDLTALEQAAAIRRGDLSSAELVGHYLARIKAIDGSVGAFVTLAPSPAADGDSPLRGVPTAIKDLHPTAGLRTALGSAAFADFVPDFDADAVAAIRHAGMPILGKTATSEFGISLYTETALGPPARNPWSLSLTPGGSSGGAAAAVAAGLVPVAQASDGGGSARIPAALCGLVGYKPSRGVVPGGPVGYGGFGLPTNAAIGRTVADCAALVSVMAAPVPGEPYPPPAPQPAPPLDRVRVGRFTTPMLAEAPVDPDCVAAVDAVASALAAVGAAVDEVAAPFDPSVLAPFEVVWSVMSLAPVPPEREHLLLPITRWMRERGSAASAADLGAALTALQQRVRAAATRLAGYDLLLCPTVAGTRASIGEFAARGPAEDFAAQARFSPYCAVFNLTGGPAISLPAGRTGDGLPVGAMLAAAPGADALLLAAATAVEEAMPWAHRHPEIWYDGAGS